MIEPDVWLSHTSWYAVPTLTKDGAGPGGGTLQGRITCKDGAHQTDPPSVAACRRSRYKRGCLLEFDFSQIELRVAALLSGDQGMIDNYVNGWDLHTRRAAKLWSPSSLLTKYPMLGALELDAWERCGPFKEHERDTAKHVNFADLFRAGAPKMQLTVWKKSKTHIPLGFFEHVVATRPTDRPGLYAWQDSLIFEARTHGRVTLPFTGQSRAFLGGAKFDENEIVNFPVQTTAGNAVLRVMARLQRQIQGRRGAPLLTLNTYDALLYDCPSEKTAEAFKDDIEEAFHWLQTVDYWHMLQSHVSRKVPLAYSTKILH